AAISSILSTRHVTAEGQSRAIFKSSVVSPQPPEINEQAPQCSRQSPQIVSGRSSVDSQVRRRSPSPRSGARRSIDSIQSDSIQSVARGIGFSNAVDFP
ncbi:hypothetical protein HN873_052595, partial [Arachis hypogaea]